MKDIKEIRLQGELEERASKISLKIPVNPFINAATTEYIIFQEYKYQEMTVQRTGTSILARCFTSDIEYAWGRNIFQSEYGRKTRTVREREPAPRAASSKVLSSL